MIPLSVVASRHPNATALTVNHEGQSIAATISFNLAPGISLSQAMTAVDRIVAQTRLPSSLRGRMQAMLHKCAILLITIFY